ncbi:MAG: endonuclease/exonuclease/phosphatase family protein, partial [bacterium]
FLGQYHNAGALLFGAGQPKHLLVEQGSFGSSVVSSSGPIRIATYNVHGPLTEDVEGVYSVLNADEKMKATHVWALQEVRTGKDRNFARETAQRLGINYAHAIARPRGEGWEGISFLSRLPISEVKRLELPHLDTGKRLRVALFITVSAGDKKYRLCNVHLPIRMNQEKRAEQLRLILQTFETGNETAGQIILGDFNTITRGLRRLYASILENRAFVTPFGGNSKTYQRYFFLRFKLDWIYVKGVEVVGHGIEQEITFSDHRPVWVDLR